MEPEIPGRRRAPQSPPAREQPSPSARHGSLDFRLRPRPGCPPGRKHTLWLAGGVWLAGTSSYWLLAPRASRPRADWLPVPNVGI